MVSGDQRYVGLCLITMWW